MTKIAIYKNFGKQLYIIIVGCSREGGHCLPVGHRVQEGCDVLECQLKGNCLAVEKVSTGFTIILLIYISLLFYSTFPYYYIIGTFMLLLISCFSLFDSSLFIIIFLTVIINIHSNALDFVTRLLIG